MARKLVVAGRDYSTRSRRCHHEFNNAECFRAAIPTHPNNNPIRSVGISWRHNILHVTLTRQRPVPLVETWVLPGKHKAQLNCIVFNQLIIVELLLWARGYVSSLKGRHRLHCLSPKPVAPVVNTCQGGGEGEKGRGRLC